jgi:type I restriction enzyme M protein
LGDAHIRKVVEAYKELKNEDGFSKAIETEKKKRNDYNLNVTLYVFLEEETEEIDVTKEWEELRKLEVELAEVEMRIEGYIRELHKGE